jgi:alpha-L-rhamnosidase
MFPLHPRRRTARRLGPVVALMATVGLVVAAGPAVPASAASASGSSTAKASSVAPASTTPWPSAPNWQSYDQTPTSATVCPTAVTSTAGTVSGASNLLCGGSGGATLTRTSSGATPTIVLDYGKNVGGIPFFTVSAESGSPTLQAGYSEAGQYETATGDGGVPWAEGDSSRSDDYPVSASGTITNRYVQGGERYEEITLTSAGSVTLSAVGINYIADRTQAANLPGYFDSSSTELNQIWYDSEYTDQLDSVPAGSLPGAWTINGGVLDAAGASSAVGLLNQGSTWTNYTTTFDADVVDNQAGWAVRGKDANDAYVFILNDSTDTTGTPNRLQEFDLAGGTYNSLGTVTLPNSLLAGTWHTVTTTVSGSTITVSLDNTTLTTLTNTAYSTGTVGFRESTGEEADFKDLTVTSSTGSTLYSDTLSSSANLADFSIPGVNQYASILDGAKRDRAIWVGDMNVETPSVFYSTDDAAYIKGSLQLLGSYQLSSGFVTGDLPPQDPLHTGAAISGTTGTYSASYSMYFVLGLEDYYLYSGDTTFIDQEWPIAQAELAWNATQLDSNGLFVTNSSDDDDWDYYDGGKDGEVTEYNLLYYKALLDGAILATAAGNTSQAATYTSEAAALKTAINAHLYNSSTGLYYLSNGDTTTVAQDANSLAVLYGVAPTADDTTLLATLKTDLWTTAYGPRPFSGSSYADVISPFVSGYELDARLAANDTADAQTLLNTVWGGMIAPGQNDTSTMWENVSGTNGQPGNGAGTSLSHGWSTTPVSALSGEVLGVQPDTAGYATWTVEPHPGNLSWAEGNVPTPHGNLSVDWAGESGVGQFSVSLTAPSGTIGTIAVPTYGATTPVVELNGQVVWSNGAYTGVSGTGITGASADANYVYLTGVQPGSYTASSNPGNYGVPTGYTLCAAENATCSFTGTESVAFGANGIYSYTTATGSTACNNTVLPDPDYGALKSCYVGAVTTGPSGTTYCAPENGLCAFSGTRTVEFGAGSSFTSKSLTGGTPCNNTVFGDPDYGVVKACFLEPAS